MNGIHIMKSRKRYKWPNNKDFAFTIIDDTDNATVENIKPIYDLLIDLGLKTTKTVWVYPPKDRFTGESLIDNHYLDFVKSLKRLGFEIALHGIGSGDYNRKDILKGLELYKDYLDDYPSMNINHAQNPSNMYFGIRGGSQPLQWYSKYSSPKDKFYGHDPKSEYFWGDKFKQHIKYVRGRIFNDINTLKQDPLIPFIDRDKEAYSNYWFSSSDGENIEKFNSLITKENVDRLSKEGGLCIIYTHFAYGFVDENGDINKEFRNKLQYLASKNGWFVPASEILDFILTQKKSLYANQFYQTFLDLRNIIKNKVLK